VRLRAPGDFAGDFPISNMPLLRSRIGARSTRCLLIQAGISGAFALYVITAKITCTVQCCSI
jgi:hypothetical protein